MFCITSLSKTKYGTLSLFTESCTGPWRREEASSLVPLLPTCAVFLYVLFWLRVFFSFGAPKHNAHCNSALPSPLCYRSPLHLFIAIFVCTAKNLLLSLLQWLLLCFGFCCFYFGPCIFLLVLLSWGLALRRE